MVLHSNEVCISGMTENQCKAKDDTWRNSAECETNVLQNFNLIDKKLPIIDLFLNPEKRARLKATENKMRELSRSNFPSEEIGRNLTSLFNLLWNSNLPCFGRPDDSGGYLLKKCFLYGQEMDCRQLFKPVPTDSGICCAFNHRQLLRDSQYSHLLRIKQSQESHQGHPGEHGASAESSAR